MFPFRSIVVGCAVAPSVLATDIPVENHSFELPEVGPNGFTGQPPVGWQHSGGGTAGVFYPTEAGWGYVTSHGNQLAYMNAAFIEQTVEASLEPDVLYSLSIDVIHRPGFYNGYTIELHAGDAVIVSDSNTVDPPPGEFEVVTLTFLANEDHPEIGQPLKIRIGGPTQVNFDNVRLETPGCIADCNADGNLNILDFVCFQGLFKTGNLGADCDANGVLNILDFVCFQSAFMDGCD